MLPSLTLGLGYYTICLELEPKQTVFLHSSLSLSCTIGLLFWDHLACYQAFWLPRYISCLLGPPFLVLADRMNERLKVQLISIFEHKKCTSGYQYTINYSKIGINVASAYSRNVSLLFIELHEIVKLVRMHFTNILLDFGNYKI